jgi:hypothetical protein
MASRRAPDSARSSSNNNKQRGNHVSGASEKQRSSPSPKSAAAPRGRFLLFLIIFNIKMIISLLNLFLKYLMLSHFIERAQSQGGWPATGIGVGWARSIEARGCTERDG